MPAMTPDFWYSPTRFSKKLVFPCKEEGHTKLLNIRIREMVIERQVLHMLSKPTNLKRDLLHEVKRIGCVVLLGYPEGLQQPVGNKFNVLRHELGVHADELHGQCIGNKVLLNLNSAADNFVHPLLGQLLVQKAGKGRQKSLSDHNISL